MFFTGPFEFRSFLCWSVLLHLSDPEYKKQRDQAYKKISDKDNKKEKCKKSHFNPTL